MKNSLIKSSLVNLINIDIISNFKLIKINNINFPGSAFFVTFNKNILFRLA